MRIGTIVGDNTACYRWAAGCRLTWTFGRLAGWQRRPVSVDTDWRLFAGVQVFGWHVGVCR